MAAEELKYTVKAEGADKAAADLDNLADKAGKIEGKTVEAKVAIDTSRADEAIKRVDTDLADLSDTDKVALLRLEAKQFEREIGRARKDLADLDGEEAQARISVIDNARANLDRIQSKIEEIDRKTVDVKVTADTSQARGALDDLDGEIAGIDGRLAGLASSAGPAGVAAALGAGAVALGQQWAAAGVEVATIATLLGSSAEEASKLRAAFGAVGVEANDVQDIVLQTNGVLAQQPELARQLGVTLGQSPLENFKKIVAATEAIEDPMKRATLQSQLFGEEGVRQVARVTAQFGSLKEAIDQVDTSQVFTEDDIARAREFTSMVTKAKIELQGIGAQIGKDLVGSVSDLDKAWRAGPGDLTLADGVRFSVDQAVSSVNPLVRLGMDLKDVWKDGFASTEDAARKASEAYLEHETAELGAERASRRAEDQARRHAETIENKWIRAEDAATEATRRFIAEQDRTPGAYDRVGAAIAEHITNLQSLVAWTDRYRDSMRQANAAQQALVNFGTLTGQQDALDQFEKARQEWMTQNHEAVFAGELGLDPAPQSAEAADALKSARDAAVAAVRAAMALGKTSEQQAQRGAATLATILDQNPWLRDQLGGLLSTLTAASGGGGGGTLPGGTFLGQGGKAGITINVANVQTAADPGSVSSAVAANGRVNGFR